MKKTIAFITALLVTASYSNAVFAAENDSPAETEVSQTEAESEEKEEQVPDAEAAKEVDDIANQQDAPFPDLNENGNSAEDVASLPMNPPEPEQVAPAPQGTEDFKMFDDRDDEPF